MPRRFYETSWDDAEPPRKKSSNSASNGIGLKEGEIINDIQGSQWQLGKSIGIGGFGEIYEAFGNVRGDSKTDKPSYVAKIEKHTNGPLFVEINCYLRIGRLEMIEEWKNERSLSFLGMPHYVASGSNIHQDEKYRFLILPRYEKDLQQILQEKKTFNLKTVLTISIQILDVLEYIHYKGYVHSDIKASNIMLSKRVEEPIVSPVRRVTRTNKNSLKKIKSLCTKRNLRPHRAVNYVDDIPYLDEVLKANTSVTLPSQRKDDFDRVYLLDYGLASKYLLFNGEHREFARDERRAHAGTILFCSRDAHEGIPSRRSDLESLAYNIVYWLTGNLPWLGDVEQPSVVEKKKIRCFKNLKRFLEACFNNYPHFLLEFFNYLNKLQFEENPNYEYLRNLCKKALKTYGYKNDWKLDFDNTESCVSHQKKQKRRKVIGCENKLFLGSFLKSNSILMPLHSNIIFKRPKLRKKLKNKKVEDSVMNWSKILIDPEVIMKQATKERKTMDNTDQGTISLSSEDLERMNPTYAMLEVYNKCKEREFSPKHKGDCSIVDNIEGYTPAMMSVYRRMKEWREFEYEQAISSNGYDSNIRLSNKNGRRSKKKLPTRVKRSTSPQVHKLSSRSKSHLNVSQKKESLPLKRTKSISLKRTYSLRG